MENTVYVSPEMFNAVIAALDPFQSEQNQDDLIIAGFEDDMERARR